MAETVYVLCALTSALCAALLLRTFLRSRAKLLLWTSLCFIGLALNNALLFVDLVVLPSIDLVAARNITALLAMSILLYGLVWESK